MKNKKLLGLLVLSAAMLFGVTACGGGNETDAGSTAQSEIQGTDADSQNESNNNTYSGEYDFLSNSFECSTKEELHMPSQLMTYYEDVEGNEIIYRLQLPITYDDAMDVYHEICDKAEIDINFSEETILGEYGVAFDSEEMGIGRNLLIQVKNYGDTELSVGDCINNSWYYYFMLDDAVEEYITDRDNGDLSLQEDGKHYDSVGWFLNNWGAPTWLKVTTQFESGLRYAYMGYDTDTYTIIIQSQYDTESDWKTYIMQMYYIPSECRESFYEHFDEMNENEFEIEKGEITM